MAAATRFIIVDSSFAKSPTARKRSGFATRSNTAHSLSRKSPCASPITATRKCGFIAMARKFAGSIAAMVAAMRRIRERLCR